MTVKVRSRWKVRPKESHWRAVCALSAPASHVGAELQVASPVTANHLLAPVVLCNSAAAHPYHAEAPADLISHIVPASDRLRACPNAAEMS